MAADHLLPMVGYVATASNAASVHYGERNFGSLRPLGLWGAADPENPLLPYQIWFSKSNDMHVCRGPEKVGIAGVPLWGHGLAGP